jgi:hypothetical protein
MTLDGLCIRLRNLTNRRLGRYAPTRVVCWHCDESVTEWITIRWQVTDKDHWPSTDGREIAMLCLRCAVPARTELCEAIENTIQQVLCDCWEMLDAAKYRPPRHRGEHQAR